MKTTSIAATAALLGSVTADGWEGWSNSTTTKSADPTTWTDWSSTSKTPDATTYDSKTWSEWSSTSSKTPDAKTSTDPAWGDWEGAATTSSKPNTATSKTSEWESWSSTSSKPVTKTSTDPNWSDWASTTSSKPAGKTSTDPAWGNWDDGSKKTTSTKPSNSKTTDQVWGNWDGSAEPTVTLKSTSTQWITVTVYHNDGGQTWSAWSTPAVKTQTNTDTVVVSKTVTKTTSTGVSSWGQWAEPSLAVDPNCKLEVSLSYGLPIWVPTPSVNWDDWNSASSTKPVTKTSSTGATSWGEWGSTTTSSKPAVKTSTDPANWANWDDASNGKTSSTKPNTATSATTWASWDGGNKVAVPTGSASASWDAWNSATGSKTSSSGGAAQTSWGSWNQDGNGISANGNKFGMTYSPYTANSQCKDQGTVSKDIAAMASKGFTSVRVYSTDCNTLEYVGAACKANGMKVILGVFISETGISGAQPQVDAIAKWAQWDLVELIVVGNEAVFSGRCSAADLAGFIASSKQTFKSAGFKGAVSTTDELSVWQSQGSVWCDVVDVVTANLYAFFNPNTAAEDAGSFIQAQIADLSQICPGKQVYVMESGWPSAGECNGNACPSPENQATAIKGIQAAVGAKVVFFSYEDEAWKQPGQFGVEQHWGCGSLFN